MYLDHNAGGRIRPEVAATLVEWLSREAANPSSVHAAGRHARSAVEAAREDVAALVGAAPREIVFTSGGTEANNHAVLGVLKPGDHAVTAAHEHASVLGALAEAERAGCTATRLSPDREGRVHVEQILGALREQTRLVSIAWANGELGSIQPIAAIAAAVRAHDPLIWTHSDAVQAVASCDIDLRATRVDLLSISGHKLGALAGVGALIVRRPGLRPLLHGGPQERERRAGTENVLGIVSFGAAARLCLAERETVRAQVRDLRERLWTALERGARPVLRLSPSDGLVSTLLVSFPGVRSDALVVALDLGGVAASAGSACAAGASEPSHAVRALGLADDVATGAIRFSLGGELSEQDIDRAAAAIARAVRRARPDQDRTLSGSVDHAA